MHSNEKLYSFKILEKLSSISNLKKHSDFFLINNMPLQTLNINISDINVLSLYYYLGLNLTIIHETANSQLPSSLNSIMDQRFFKILKSVLLDRNDEIVNTHPYRKNNLLNRIGIHNKKTKYKNKILNLDICFCKILNLVKIKKSISFNENIIFFEKLNWDKKHSDKIVSLKDISDKYLTKEQFNYIEEVLKESEQLISMNPSSIDKIDVLIEIEKKYIENIKKLANIMELDVSFDSLSFSSFNFHLPSFKQDALLFKKVIDDIVEKEPLFALHSGIKNFSIDFLLDKKPFAEKLKSEKIIAHNIESNQKQDAVIFFEDSSFLIKKHGENDFINFYRYEEIDYLISVFLGDYIKYLTKKTPTIKRAFFNMYCKMEFINSEEFYYCIRSINCYNKNSEILKSMSFDLVNTISKENNFSQLENIMYSIIEKHDIDKYSKILLGNKYSYLFSESIDNIFTEFYNNDISSLQVKKYIGHKIASFKNTEALAISLKQTLNLLTNFSLEYISKSAKEIGAIQVFSDNKCLILKIETFEQSKKLGSSAWCISQNDLNFSNYIANGEKQYFMYDFNKSSCDNDSLIGCTLTNDFKFRVAHFKNDKPLLETDAEIQYIIKKAKSFR